GLVAFEMAVTQPAAVRSLHLIEPPWLDLLPEDRAVRELAERVRAIQERHHDGDEEATAAEFFTAIGSERTLERLRGTPEWQRISAHAARFSRSVPAGAYTRARLDQLPTYIMFALYIGALAHSVAPQVGHALCLRIG